VTVEPSDADGVAAALGQLLDEPERRAELARAGRKRVEQLFDIRTVAEQMDDFIEACLGAGRGHAQVSDSGHQAAVPL
jgi:glycosyltransferase involved in cell wall biosynthesis